MDFSKFFDALKLGPRVLLGIVLASGTLTFARPALVTQLGLTAILREYRGWLGGAFVVSAALLASHAIVAGSGAARGWYRNRKRMRTLRRSLNKLSPPEKAVLREYVIEGTTTRYDEISDGVIGGLIAKGLVYRASNVSAHSTRFAFNLQPWVWEHLQRNPEVLSVTQNGATSGVSARGAA